ncbi:protein binding protein [Trichosporon asahii var. asahii CBS 2479]|uniref:Protein binding protein n=1 Tax=Trichosporon asahii var. asahii (strain ATCC 90039 / CBS 2479 / JCM 2466 / KCTC 7840 / NBRC 103889/ NCYC 2677 / UAMH 7654) TaxID=1186058 RepID=J4UAC1_TRIAS|nr:protein binding protein [Trichosporon asahii var. asahii CBS 2479]EJT47680.1 protein binding protein [Trichosporon asahii var. asahii CBS 2479]
MSVTLTPPNQLGFPRPLTTIVKRSLYIHNPHSSPVAFKVKTTAPKQYCVRPNQGRVEPGENLEVQIVLQPLPQDPPPHAKCKDKFLVQSAFIPADEEMRSLPEMWASVERTNKASIQEQKIRCAYLPAEDGSGNANGIPEEEEGSPHDTTHDTSRLDESVSDPHSLISLGYTHPLSCCLSTRDRSELVAPLIPLSSLNTPPGALAERELPADLYPNRGWTVWELDDPPATTPQEVLTKDPFDCKPKSLGRAPGDLVIKVEQSGAPPQIVVYPAIYSAAEASPAAGTGSKLNGNKDLPATPTRVGGVDATSAGLTGAAAGGATGLAALAGTRAAGHGTQSDAHRDTSGGIPSLTTADIAASNAPAPTNIALEKSVDIGTSDKEKLQTLLAENDRLRAQLAEAQGPNVVGLRKRGGAAADGGVATKTATAVQAAPAQGVPVEVCAGLVFVVFILTYLFF